jgi:hypothetical protein
MSQAESDAWVARFCSEQEQHQPADEEEPPLPPEPHRGHVLECPCEECRGL